MPIPDYVTEEFIYRIAQDGKVARAAQGLAEGTSWRGPRISADGTWLFGSIQGSLGSPYEIVVDLIDPKRVIALCDCPSLKRPCKHSLGLILLALRSPDRLEVSEPPPSVIESRTQVFGPRPDKPPPRTEARPEDPESVGEALVQEIFASPTDEAPRLIYADWLQEQGGPREQDRGEFIHLQCQLHHLPGDAPGRAELLAREKKIWKKYRSKWLAPVPPKLRRQDLVFQRGFLEELPITARGLRRWGKQIFDAHPVTRVRITGQMDSTEASKVAVLPFLARITTLSLEMAIINQHKLLDCLLTSPFLSQVTDLRLGGNGFTWQAVESLLRLPLLSKITHLSLRGNLIGAAGAQRIAECDRLQALRHLDLSKTDIGSRGARVLAASPHLGKLETLLLLETDLYPRDEAILRQRFGDRVRFA
jgi:uncharacterized protein (TIGR02996 family)